MEENVTEINIDIKNITILKKYPKKLRVVYTHIHPHTHTHIHTHFLFFLELL